MSGGGGTVRTPGDITMAGPRLEAGNSQPRRVRPSRAVNSISWRGKVLTVIVFFGERVELDREDGNGGGCTQRD